MMKKKLFFVLAMVMVLSMLMLACAKKESDPATTEKPDTPSTDSSGGDVTPSVEPVRVGVVTILGRPLEIIYEDNGETEQSYVNAAVKALSSDDVCAVYSNGYSSQIELVLPQAQKYGIPYIGGNSSHALLEKGYTYYWMLRLSDRYVSPAMVNACVELGMKNPAILHVTDSYGVGMAEKAIAEVEGMTVAARIGVGDNEQQFTPYLTQIMNSDADGIIAIQHQDQAALVMMQVDAMAIELPLMGCSQYASALAIDTAGETANGWYSLADWTVQTDTETGKAFVDAYRAAYNRDPDMQSVTAYDSMFLLKDAIERAGSDDPDAINKALGETKDLPGAMTTYTFQGDNSLGTTIFLVQTENLQGTLKGLVTR
jgi:ABC-type branched-subunit amino acid transport system substrate-binding protein